MLTVSGISKSFGGRTLFADVSFQVNREDRIGLVGPNGAGKTTLFSLLLGQESPDEGIISMQRGVTLGAGQAPAGGPTSVAVHDAGDVGREVARVDVGGEGRGHEATVAPACGFPVPPA